MTIRAAALADVPTIVELGRAMLTESPRWSRLTYNGQKVAETLERFIRSPDGFVWVAVSNDAVVGLLVAFIEEYWAADERVAQELALFVRPDVRGALCAARLIAALDAWANLRGAKLCQCGTSTGVDNERTAQLYERLGFERCAIGLERSY